MKISSCRASFSKILHDAQKVVVITGAGVSAESNIPTFRGTGGYWRRYEATSLATPGAFRSNPSLVWEFYHYRRELVRKCSPNNGHKALALLEQKFIRENKDFFLITTNSDGLHQRAGNKNVLELHGALYNVKCTACSYKGINNDSPIVPALDGKGLPDANQTPAMIPIKDLPACPECGGLLRPDIVWFGENLDHGAIEKASKKAEEADLVLIVGTTSVVYPAAMIAPNAANRGVPVAEFNIEHSNHTSEFQFHFQGPSGTTLPQMLGFKELLG